MSDIFTLWVNFVLSREGGLTNDANDPGGLTNFGIDQRSHPQVDIRHLTRDQAVEIYRTSYWQASHADKLPPPVALVYADAAVNQGLGEAARLLQQALDVTVDGAIGPATLAAVARHDPAALATEFTARRVLRYAETDHLADFGLGWMRRAQAALALALWLPA